jgi:hypothetical protein
VGLSQWRHDAGEGVAAIGAIPMPTSDAQHPLSNERTILGPRQLRHSLCHRPHSRSELARSTPGPPAGGRPPRAWSTVWELAGLFGNPIDPARLDAFARELMRLQPGLVESRRATRFFVESYAIAPESYGAPPLTRRPIHETSR